MHELEVVVSERSFLGRFTLPAGDLRQYRVHFEGVLGCSQTLIGAVTSVTSPISTVSAPQLWNDKRSLTFNIQANTSFEIFTLSLQVQDSLGEVLNFTAIFEVTAPVTQTLMPNPLPVIIGPTGPTGPGVGPTGPTGAGAFTGPTGPIAGGLTVTVITAQLTPGGHTGSMQFVGGALQAQVQAT